MKKGKKDPFTKEILEEEIKNGLCRSDIAKKYNCSHLTVTKNIKKFGLKIKKGNPGGKNKKNMVGFKIGSIEVIEEDETYIGPNNDKILMWKCKCLCGNYFVSRGADLRLGRVKTCGCRIRSRKQRCWHGYEEISGTQWKNIYEGAIYRRIDLDITIEQIWDLFLKQNRKCALTGEEIILSPLSQKTASLDRIDNTKGYTIDNVQWVHKDINILKHAHRQEKFIELCKKVANYADNKKNIEEKNEINKPCPPRPDTTRNR